MKESVLLQKKRMRKRAFDCQEQKKALTVLKMNQKGSSAL